MRILFMCIIFILLSTTIFAYDYGDALEKGLWFFDANRCGPDAGLDSVCSSWRGACHTNDSAGGVDLTGGYHDAGDHVKFGLPQTFSASMLGWALYEYRSTFDKAGVTAKAESVIKYFIDFFLKCHPNPNVFWYGVGDGHGDHGYWGPPESQSGRRPARSAPPGADVCGEAAAALALHYLNFGGSYGKQCLDAAIEIYNIGIENGGRASDGGGGSFYRSSSHYDDLGWGGIWLSIATGDQSYLDPIDAWLDIPNDPGDNHYQKQWAPAWDDVHLFVMLKMAELTGEQKYLEGVKWNLEWYRDDLRQTPFGLPYLDVWGVLRYASNEAGLGYLTYKLLGYDGFVNTADMIMDYTLGDNPRNSSYVTNYLKNPPRHPHHRANEPNRNGSTNGMIGALVGGPDDGDGYRDDVNDYYRNEVAIDYNAGFILGMAGRAYFHAGGTAATPAPTPTPAPSTPPGTGDGLLGKYYLDRDFNQLDFTRVDPEIDLDWGGGSPGGNMPHDAFAIRWTGTIESRISETYTFYTQSDDGIRVWINKQLVIDDWNDHAAGEEYEARGTIALEMGGLYPITIEFYENWGDAELYLWWSNRYLPREIVPQSQLYSGETPTVAPTITPTSPPTKTTEPGSGNVWIQPETSTVNTGADFSVQIRANTGSQKLAAYEFRLKFDNNLINLDSSKGNYVVENGPDGIHSEIEPPITIGQIPPPYLKLTGFKSSGTGPGPDLHLLTIHFTAGSQIGSSALDLQVKNFLDVNAYTIGDPHGIGGRVEIVEGCAPGDVNLDGVIDSIDALFIAQYYVGIIKTLAAPACADVNCDNKIDIIDAMFIAQYYVDIINEFPCS